MNLTRRAVGVLVPALLVVAAAVAPAWAAGGIDIETPEGGLAFERLAPGYGASAELRVRNGSEHDATVTLSVQDVLDDENGCIRQESREGDACDLPGGELSGWLHVQVEDEGDVVWSGPMRSLSAGAIIDDAMPSGSERPLTIAVSLPIAAGNDTMTDRVSFVLRVDATAETGETETEVLGVEATANGGTAAGQPAGGGEGFLPLTGGTVGRWTLWAAAFLVGSGSYLVLASRRQRRQAIGLA